MSSSCEHCELGNFHLIHHLVDNGRNKFCHREAHIESEAAMRRLDLRRFIQRPHSTGACCRGMRCHASVHKYVLASMCDKSDRMSSKFLDETRCHSICRIMIGRVGPIQWARGIKCLGNEL
nr:uncharacterized protein LOC112282091 isoform X1 [Physcomitrium patens]|eukprot:XP_024375061.1 uncharacterized protein LOC112282091 isoform X1 [Physcomitrella patens]